MKILSEQLFQRIFNSSAACVLLQVSDPEYIIIAVSNKYLDLTSTKRIDLVGKNIFDIFPDQQQEPSGAITTRKAILTVCSEGKPVVIPDYLYYIHSPQTGKLEPYWWKSTFEPIFDEYGNVEYVLGTAVDQTIHHLIHHDLDRAEQMLHLAIDAGNIGTWNIDVETKAIVSSARSKALYGLRQDENTTIEGILEAIHPDYREKVAAALNDAMSSDGKESFIIDYPVKGIADQRERWVRSTAKLFATADEKTRLLCGTLIDITESKLLEQKKDDFITIVSHEMKTPLTAVTMYLDLVISKTKQFDGLVINMLSKARAQTVKLKDMVVSFLDLASIDDGKMNLNKSSFGIRELMEEVVNDSLPFSSAHQIALSPAADITIFADRAKIGQVINNFLSNAIKYSPPDTKITIDYSIMDGDIKIMVSDQGTGIPPQYQKKVFERFYRVENSNKVKSGFGIGLYLAAEIIRNHHGEIGVQSDEDKGSIFWFTLPLNHLT